MPETARYTALVAKNANQAASDMSKVLQVDIEAEQKKVQEIGEKEANSFGLFSKEFLTRHGLHLLAQQRHGSCWTSRTTVRTCSRRTSSARLVGFLQLKL